MLKMASNKNNKEPLKKGKLIEFNKKFDYKNQDWLVHIFEKYRKSLGQYLLRKTGSEQDAGDLTQDTFIRLMRYKNPADIENIQAFLFTTAANLFRDKLRRNKARHVGNHVPIENGHLISAEGKLESNFQSSDEVSVLLKALSELQPEYRRALLMHKFEEKTHAEIAKSLNTTVGVVRRYINVALLHCRNRVHPKI